MSKDIRNIICLTGAVAIYITKRQIPFGDEIIEYMLAKLEEV